MDRRAFLERLAAVATVTGLAGCTNPPGNDGSDTAAESRTAAGTRTGTASEQPATEQPTTTNGPPDIPRPGTPPMATTAGRMTTSDPPDIPPPGTPPTATTETTETTDDGPPDIPRPGTPPGPHGTTGGSCSLSHRVVDSGDDLTPSSVSVIQYADLSTTAKRIVGRAIESNETVSIPYDSRQRPPEFAYADESHVYDIEYRGTTYRLVTASGMGCPARTKTE